jgi:predicted MFS family arabinose efflux permease
VQVRGRVAALLSSTVSTAAVVSMALAGIFGQLVGVRAVFLLAAGVVALAALVGLVLFRGARSGASDEPAVELSGEAIA